jgi:ankyrin repeat protein
VKLLLEKGAELEAKDEDSPTPLSWAARNGNEAVVKLLLERGAELETKDEDSPTPLSWAARMSWCNTLRRVT